MLTPQEAADALGVSRQTIYNRISCGALPAVRTGPRQLRIPAHAIYGLRPEEMFKDTVCDLAWQGEWAALVYVRKAWNVCDDRQKAVQYLAAATCLLVGPCPRLYDLIKVLHTAL